MGQIISTMKEHKIMSCFIIVIFALYIIAKFVLPGVNSATVESSPVKDVKITNSKVYKQGETISTGDFDISLVHENGKESEASDAKVTLSRKKPLSYGKTTPVDVTCKVDGKTYKKTVKIKNKRDAVVRFNCGTPNLKGVKAVYYDNGELCFEGKGDVRKFNDYPWLNYEGDDDYAIKSVTFESGVTPTSMDNWFSGLETLVYVGDLPTSVQSLRSTFEGCTSLKKGAKWSQCSGLLDATAAYKSCSSLKSIPELPVSLRLIDELCSGDSEIKNAPDLSAAVNVTSAASAFSDCEGLITASMAPNLVEASSMYANCINLKEMPTLSTKITSLDSTFSGDISLITTTAIPASVTNMSSCFNGCEKLTGELTINANPTEYSGCFSGACIATKLDLKGGSKILNAIALEQESGNITVNGKAPVTTE